MKRAWISFLLFCFCLPLYGCNHAAAASVTIADDVVDIEAPLRSEAPKRIMTPPPTPTPTPEPTPSPTPEPSPSPSPKATEKAKATQKPKKTEASTAAFVEDDNASLMPVIANDPDTAISEILSMTNQQRANNGLSTLKKSSALMSAAATRAREISVSFSHTRPNGSSALSISSSAYAENIASGMNISHATIMDGWMNSSGHRANILNGSYNTIGIGFYSANGYNYYVQLFGY